MTETKTIRFDEKPFLDAANILVEADETELALKVLNCMPAYYRDNPPQAVHELRRLIWHQITLPYDLLGDPRENPKSDEWSQRFTNGTMRGHRIRDLVREYNEQGKTPHIVDVGPGDFTFAIALHLEKYRFTYRPYTLNIAAATKVAERLEGKVQDKRLDGEPVIFVACEIIEHLTNPLDLRQCLERVIQINQEVPEHLVLSTPKYTFENGTPNWRQEGIHHLRAYTPTEFGQACAQLFPEYAHKLYDDGVMVIVSYRNKTL